MKRLFLAIAALAALVSCSTDRSKILKVYNWADYIDETQIAEFEQWYQEQTGKEVHVVYQTFDINESMLTKIEKGHEDYDVVCPSDYIIERMLRSDLLLPIDRNFGDTPDYTQNVAPFIVDKFRQIEGSGKDANDYAVSYMWGTIGIIYNPKFVSEDDVKTWNVLRDPRFKDRIYMKEAFRDVYTTLLIALNRDAIDSGEKSIEELPFDTSDESIAMVEQFLNECKPNIAGYEADFGKEYMTQEKGWMNLSWSGDAAWAIQEAKDMGVELRYAIPEEASIVWFDGWVIPKYARNVDAARYFINFLCRPEMAVRNMDEIGYVSAVGGPEILAAKNDPTEFEAEDATYFFGEDGKGVCIDPVQYPSDEIIARCGMLHDSGSRTEALQEMWSRVKGDSASAWTYMIIGVAVIGIVAVAIGGRNKKNRRKPRRR
ncbi:MAG: ABC transporter substrate-binding protein [Bacteroidales bacterium]|nr:ABC transporter substrate-binding protein [Candidatus Cryptobacteroides choladohippi]